MGIGVWIWNLPPLVGDANNLAYWREIVNTGFSHVVLKVLDGQRQYNGDALRPQVDRAHAEGLHVWVWGYEYQDLQAAAMLGQRAATLGANGVVIDAEKEWAGARTGEGEAFVSGVRAAFDGPVYLSSYASKSGHPEFPWDEFAGVDGYMPQVYGTEPSVDALVGRALDEFSERPVIPTGLADASIGSERQLDLFLASCRSRRIGSANLWVWEHMTQTMKAAVQAAAADAPTI